MSASSVKQQFVRTNNANMEEAGSLEKISRSGFCYPAFEPGLKTGVEQGHGTQSNPFGGKRHVIIGKPILEKTSQG